MPLSLNNMIHSHSVDGGDTRLCSDKLDEFPIDSVHNASLLNGYSYLYVIGTFRGIEMPHLHNLPIQTHSQTCTHTQIHSHITGILSSFSELLSLSLLDDQALAEQHIIEAVHVRPVSDLVADLHVPDAPLEVFLAQQGPAGRLICG